MSSKREQALIAAAEKFVEKVESGRAKSKETYSELKAALSMPEWRLWAKDPPPLNKNVLVWKEGWAVDIAHMANDNDYGLVWSFSDGGCLKPGTITHWTEMPEEPKS